MSNLAFGPLKVNNDYERFYDLNRDGYLDPVEQEYMFRDISGLDDDDDSSHFDYDDDEDSDF